MLCVLQIWQIADTENRGLLTPAGFGTVLRLIGHYQAGREPSPELALQPGPLPKFVDESPSGSTSPTIQPPPGPPPSALQPQASGTGPIRVPPLPREKAAQYAALFDKSGAENGILSGEKAKNIFERAGLPNETLGRIWNLADTEQRGALVVTEFVIAMHLLASSKAGTLRALPNILPPGLYEAAAMRPPSRQNSGANTMSAIPRQFSGAPRTASPLSRPPATFSAPQQFPQTTGFHQSGFGSSSSGYNDWAITPMDKQKFDTTFERLDHQKKGFITGDEAVSFFSESKLPEEALAQIWDLADIKSMGRLGPEEFAVAMYLIRQQRSKRDGRDALPASLPPNLIPPSMRNQVRPTVQPAPAFETAASTMPKSAADDLFGLDALSTPPPPVSAPTQAPQSTGGSNSFGGLNDPFGNKPPISPIGGSSVFKPFNPSSSFGQTLSYNATGGSNASGPTQQRNVPSATEDLLGDNDPEISSKLTSETTELANLSNQVGNLSKQMQEVQGQRATSQNELTHASAQKHEFEQRLAQLRALYEQEVKDVKSLQEQLANSRRETGGLQTEIAMLDKSFQDIKQQHAQVSAALQTDLQENADLKERMKVINAETAQLKPALEKLRSDARQQKGLVAINKKQLATNEGEREKMKQEAEELNRSIEEDKKELAAAAKAQSQIPVATPQVASPALSTMSATNPFFRRQGSSGEQLASSPFTSPAASLQQDQSFENVFGPSFGAAATAKESHAPPTTFRQESVPQLGGQAHQFTASPPTSPPTTNREINQGSEPTPPPSTDAPISHVGTTPTGSSISQAENIRAISPGLDRKSNASPAINESLNNSIPGAFPGDVNSQIVDTPTGGTTLSEQAASSPFAVSKDAPGSTKDDFDAAFAGFGSSAKTQEQSHTSGSSNEGSAADAPASFHKEFPPIAELEDDDDSDSASDAGGFDDDFAPGSPGHVRNASSLAEATPAATSTDTNGTDFLNARPELNQNSSALSVGTNPPTMDAQSSPPAYDNAVTSGERAHQEAENFSGLLPKREDPTSPATSPPHDVTGPSAFGDSAPFGALPPISQPVPPAKIPFDDDFDDFDDLEDAKEGDAEDDFANLDASLDRSGLDDFNPTFDSPPPPSTKTLQQSTPLNTAQGRDHDAFEDFTQSASHATQAPANTTLHDDNDWDAIFSGIDPPASTNSPKDTPEVTKPGNGTGSITAPERPQMGRALTEAGVHDDPILKNLTGMGYARADALAALEKYDYSLERVGLVIPVMQV
jgi:epidermal growth factor receptor substrate 15